MLKMLERSVHAIRALCADEGGATAIEYAMIAAGVGVAIAGTVMALGGSLKGMYQSVQAAWPS
jgi:pilus assembly protein Flp/PilA